MRKITLFLTFFILFLLNNIVFAQKNYVINGYVLDSLSGEALIGANIFNAEKSRVVNTNEFGFFSINGKENDIINIEISYVGYKKVRQRLLIQKDTTINIQLHLLQSLNTVEVTAKHREVESGVVNLPISKLKAIPSIAGEADVIKALAFLPGVSLGTEGSANLHVRGGSPDQNLLLLDGATVYNTSHLFGFLSVFNPNALKSLSFYKGNFPAKYGGRLSSVIDIAMKDGNNKNRESEYSIGMISSSFTTEGYIKKEKSSYLLAGRTAYLGLLSLPNYYLYNKGTRNRYVNYNMYDLNGKVNFELSKKDKLFISFYTGQDFFVNKNREQKNQEGTLGLDWGNKTGTVRYTRILKPNLFFHSMANYNQFQYNLENAARDSINGNIVFSNTSSVRDILFKNSFDWQLEKHFINMGTEIGLHEFRPNIVNVRTLAQGIDSTLTGFANRHKPNSFAAYIDDEFKINRWNVRLGVRTVLYQLGKKSYLSVEPRAVFGYQFENKSKLELSYNRMQQPIHLLSTTSASTFGNDIWVPAIDNVKPQVAHQIALGYTTSIGKSIDIQADIFYKRLKNQIDYRQGINFLQDSKLPWDKLIEKNGIGQAAGFELYVSKETERRSIALSYTLSASYRKFDNINSGDWYPHRYDKRHSLNLIGEEKLNDRWKLNWNIVMSTGNAVTLPEAVHYDLETETISEVYTRRNNFRMPFYNRADLGFTYAYQTRKNRDAKWIFSVYNAYAYPNAFALEYFNGAIRQDSNDIFSPVVGRDGKAYRYSIFRFIPGVSYSIKLK